MTFLSTGRETKAYQASFQSSTAYCVSSSRLLDPDLVRLNMV